MLRHTAARRADSLSSPPPPNPLVLKYYELPPHADYSVYLIAATLIEEYPSGKVPG